MNNKKVFIFAILLVFALAFSLGGCNKVNGGNDDPTDLSEPLTEQEILELTSDPISLQNSFTLYASNEAMGIYNSSTVYFQVKEESPNLHVQKERYDKHGYIDTYILKPNGDYGFKQIKVTTSTIGEPTITEVKRLSAIQAQMEIAKLIKDEVPFVYDFIPELKKIGMESKSYDASFGNLEISGKRNLNTQNELESIEINLHSKLVLDDTKVAGVFDFYNKFDSQSSLTEARIEYKLDKDYLPSNYDYDTTSKKDILYATATLEYGNVEIQEPNLDDATVIEADRIQIELVDNYGVILDGLSLQDTYAQGTEISAGNLDCGEQDITLQFDNFYYDSAYKYPVGSTINTGFTSPLKLYGNWKGSKVVLNLDGGTLEDDIDYFTLGKYAELKPIKIGYQFGGWYKDADFADELSKSDLTVTDEPITLYAKWSSYVKITFSADVDYKILPVIGIAGNTVSYPNEDAICKRGNILGGWYKNKGHTQVADSTFPQTSTTVYAAFNEAYIVTLVQHNEFKLEHLPSYINIAKQPTNPESAFEALNQKITKNNNIITFGGEDGGYIFEKWYTDSEKTQPFSEYPNGNITLYAGFELA